MKEGPLTITDANLILGRLVPEFFPKIFGLYENESLDSKASLKEFLKLSEDVNLFLESKANEVSSTHLSVDEIAYGFIKVANEAMCRPIRALTQGKGHAAKNHILACFGGAGGQHAFAIAKSLGIKMILIHKHSSILSAYGLALADVLIFLN
jgi:5-oxoprolinase (ATP-hydrolysing)